MTPVLMIEAPRRVRRASQPLRSQFVIGFTRSGFPESGPLPAESGGRYAAYSSLMDPPRMTDEFSDAKVIELLDRIARSAAPGGRRDAEAALRELYDLASPRLYGVALRVVANREWAEDVLQETFLNIWRNAADFRASLSPPLAWLGLMARSRALDFLRRRASERADRTQQLDDVAETVAGADPNPMDTSDASEQAWALHECLRKLEARQREVVSLAYFRDLSHSELAEQLRLPLGTVKTWVRRALEQLRGCMAKFA
jgi:RNA polymerase sigma factor (sigma-70 family)